MRGPQYLEAWSEIGPVAHHLYSHHKEAMQYQSGVGAALPFLTLAPAIRSCLEFQLGGGGGFLVILVLWVWLVVTLHRGVGLQPNAFEPSGLSHTQSWAVCCSVRAQELSKPAPTCVTSRCSFALRHPLKPCLENLHPAILFC